MSLSIYTDGGCRGHPGEGAWAFIICDSKKKIFSSRAGFESSTTSNRMEFTAAIQALLSLGTSHKKTVTIYTDSKLLSNTGSIWMYRWKDNNWKTSAGKEPANLDLVLDLLKLCGIHNVTFQWVKGHNGDQWNTVAHRLVSTTLRIHDKPKPTEISKALKKGVDFLSGVRASISKKTIRTLLSGTYQLQCLTQQNKK